MRNRTRSLVAVGAVAVLGLGATTALVSSANAASPTVGRVLGLSGDGKNFVTFYVSNPTAEKSIGEVKGLDAGDTKLIGIDYRVATGKFYGVAPSGNIYTINSNTAQATKVSALTVALEGTDFAVDFNPAADRLRIISDTGQNLRHDFGSAAAPIRPVLTTADTPLAYTPGTPATGITAVAYTNNDLSVDTATSLYDVDTKLDAVSMQFPANAGTLIKNGPLGFDAAAVGGIDIFTATNSAGVATDNFAYGALRTTRTGPSTLYKIDLQSGVATKVVKLDKSVADLAFQQR